MKTCYYELLEVQQTASDDEIKKSYRKLILKYHPDKNVGNESQAAEKFRLVQEAYEVLSNPTERSWYDRHRDSLLKEDKISQSDFYNDLMGYFSSAAYDGYDDSKNGFYTVYRNLFDEILKEENEGGVFENVSFGYSYSNLDTCKKFYSFWGNFVSKRSFSWCDVYDMDMSLNRNYRRQAEKENKKARETAKKEFNETIRALVKFIQRKDLRYKTLLEEKRLAEETRKTIQKRKNKLNHNFEFEQQEWMKIEEREIYDEIYDEFYCVVCEKYFNSEKQLSKHEKSKKHLETLEELKDIMREDEDLIKVLEDLDLSFEDLEEQCDEEGKKEDIEDEKDVEGETSKGDQRRDSSDQTPSKPRDPTNTRESDPESETDSNKEEKSDEKVKVQKQEKKEKRKKRRKEKIKKQSGEICNVCHESFSSRNKLFQHIKETGHALRK